MKLDYVKLGFKCGIEIHQQLSGKKLFCDCPSIIYDGEPDTKVRRHLRALAGETGKLDKAAKHEQQKEKYYVYNFYNDYNCLVELDEEPPHEINQQAVDTALIVSKMLNMQVFDEIQVMRKTVVDGSNTSGFQRTSLISSDGFVNTSEGRVGISSLCLEEDACKIVERKDDYDVYNLTRLGIPLVEIATEPDIKSPDGAKETAAKLGMILRSTRRVLRGLGTIRQDVNVSIRDGARVEIKGAQDLKMLPTLCENEVRRQVSIIGLKGKLNPDFGKLVSVGDILSYTECKFAKKAIDSAKDNKEKTISAFKVSNFNGIFGTELSPNVRIGTEVAKYLKVKIGLGGIIHSDENFSKYKFSDKEIDEIKKKLNVKDNDAFVIMVADYNICKVAYDFIIERLGQLNKGVPSEVRKANPDGTTSYLRPMPGSARMYPETDIKNIKVTKKYFDNLELPELIDDILDKIEKKYNVSQDKAKKLDKIGMLGLFIELSEKLKNIKPSYMADLFMSFENELKKLNKKVNVELITDDVFKEILIELDSNQIPKNAVVKLLLDRSLGKELDYSKFEQVDESEIKKEIEAIVKEKPGLNKGGYMGLVMAKLKGKVDGKTVMNILNEVLH